MELRSLNLDIKSKDPEVLVEFLSNILEFEYKKFENFLTFEVLNTKFRISEEKNKKKKTPNWSLEFDLSSREEFENLGQKIDFFNYRRESDSFKPFLTSKGQESISVDDLDGRRWIFKIQ